jgi:hypothetical protein
VAGRVARDALDLAYQGIRFTLGSVRIRPGAPQTLIVVARKTP